MPPRKKPATLLVHGWSDSSRSFTGLKALVQKAGISGAREIYYGDYKSRNDELTFDDVADGLNDRLIEAGVIKPDGTADRELNVIVHSTGGLVIRHWIWRHYVRDGDRLRDCPVRRVVMLAPANFGSPLAHRGKSFFGSLVKGRWSFDDWLEVGRNLLDGLEMASPYQWELAHDDLFGGVQIYGPGRHQVQCTVLVGINDYTGMRGLINKPGTDGTVTISGCPIDARKLVLDCTGAEADAKGCCRWEESRSATDIAFGVVDEADHGTIVDNAAPGTEHDVADFVVRALQCDTAAQFRKLQNDLRHVTATTYAAYEGSDDPKPRFQQLFMHAVDDQGEPVDDFSLEYSVVAWSKVEKGLLPSRGARLTKTEQQFSDRLQKLLCGGGHQHSQDPSYRRFLVDVAAVELALQQAQAALGGRVALLLRVHAPDVDEGIHYQTDRLRNIVIHPQGRSQPKLLFPNTTTLVELRLNRYNEYVKVGRSPGGF